MTGISYIKRITGSTNSLVQLDTSDNTATALAANYITAQTQNITSVNDGMWTWEPNDLVILSASNGVSICTIDSAFTSLTAIGGIGAAAVTYTGILVNGDIPQFSGTSGVIIDSGIAAANIMQKNIINTMAAGSEIIFDKGTGTAVSLSVTINKQTGVINTGALSTDAGVTTLITLNNTEVLTSSVVLVSLMGGTNTTLGVQLSAAVTSAGVVTITVGNDNNANALNGTLIIGFAVL